MLPRSMLLRLTTFEEPKRRESVRDAMDIVSAPRRRRIHPGVGGELPSRGWSSGRVGFVPSSPRRAESSGLRVP